MRKLHGSGKVIKGSGRRRPYLNCAYPHDHDGNMINTPHDSFCPVCGHGTSDMQRDPTRDRCAVDCAIEREADNQLRISLLFDVDLGYGGRSPDEPQPAKFAQRFIPRGVIMQDVDESLAEALTIAKTLDNDVIDHIYDRLAVRWFCEKAAEAAVSNVDCETHCLIAGVQSAHRHRQNADMTIGAGARKLQCLRVVSRTIFRRIEQLICESNRAATTYQTKRVFASLVWCMRYMPNGDIDLTHREIAEITGRPERTICDIVKKRAAELQTTA